jgi:hypothetical protein
LFLVYWEALPCLGHYSRVSREGVSGDRSLKIVDGEGCNAYMRVELKKSRQIET